MAALYGTPLAALAGPPDCQHAQPQVHLSLREPFVSSDFFRRPKSLSKHSRYHRANLKISKRDRQGMFRHLLLEECLQHVLNQLEYLKRPHCEELESSSYSWPCPIYIFSNPRKTRASSQRK